MKLQLDENTLNAYINEAIRQELNENSMDELFGSRVRKQSKRMITGQGWGNQRRSQDNLWGTANTDISSTDADEEVPQTLVGMIRKMENGLCAMEELSGIGPQEAPGTLANGVAQYRNGGGFKMKASLLAAINALSRIADRLNAVEKRSGSNAIMESAGDYMDAAVGGNAVAGNARNMSHLGGLQSRAKQASAAQSAAHKAFNTANQNALNALGNPNLTQTGADKLTKAYNDAATTLKNTQNATRAADARLTANNIRRGTGFWGKQVANVKNGARGVKDGFQTIKGAKNAGNAVQAGVQAYRSATAAGKTAAQASKAAKSAIRGTKAAAQVLKGTGQIAKGVGQITQIPLLLLSIADEAARQGAQARQRKIVRTYNCASVLAKRMANIAQEIADTQNTQSQESEQLQEINVSKSRKFFDSIEAGMSQLSVLMKQINAKINTQQQQTQGAALPQTLNSPQEIKQFQEWANANGYTDERGMALALDGKWGPHTEHAYNQAAQGQQNTNESKATINEANSVMSALTDLENKVGITGSGGRAYSDISAMSGAKDGSRSQGARAAKFIIRTYPPVLNQYLTILASAGVNVSGIQPLKVDTRPLRNYDWQEIQAIDNRIKELTNIAQNVENIPGQQRGPVTLPAKPERRPQQPRQRAPQAPELPELDNNIQISDEPEIDLKDNFEPLDTSLNVKQISYPDAKGNFDVNKEKNFVDNVIDVMRGMDKNDSASQKIKKMGMDNAYNNAKLAIDRMVEWGALSSEEAKNEKKKLKYYYKQIKRGNSDAIWGNGNGRTNPAPAQQEMMNEAAFKNFVKEIIRESFKK